MQMLWQDTWASFDRLWMLEIGHCYRKSNSVSHVKDQDKPHVRSCVISDAMPCTVIWPKCNYARHGRCNYPCLGTCGNRIHYSFGKLLGTTLNRAIGTYRTRCFVESCTNFNTVRVDLELCASVVDRRDVLTIGVAKWKKTRRILPTGFCRKRYSTLLYFSHTLC